MASIDKPSLKFLEDKLFQAGLEDSRSGLSLFNPVLLQTICAISYAKFNPENTRFLVNLYQLHERSCQPQFDEACLREELQRTQKILGIKEGIADINISHKARSLLLKAFQKLDKTLAIESGDYQELQKHFETCFNEIVKLCRSDFNYNFSQITDGKLALNKNDKPDEKLIPTYLKEVEKYWTDLCAANQSLQMEIDNLKTVIGNSDSTLSSLLNNLQILVNQLSILIDNPTPTVLGDCEILVSLSPPDSKNLGPLPLKEGKIAYVLTESSLFYVDKGANRCDEIRLNDDSEISKEQLRLLKLMLDPADQIGNLKKKAAKIRQLAGSVDVPRIADIEGQKTLNCALNPIKARVLKKEELDQILAITGHAPLDFYQKFVQKSSYLVHSFKTFTSPIMLNKGMGKYPDNLASFKNAVKKLENLTNDQTQREYTWTREREKLKSLEMNLEINNNKFQISPKSNNDSNNSNHSRNDSAAVRRPLQILSSSVSIPEEEEKEN